MIDRTTTLSRLSALLDVAEAGEAALAEAQALYREHVVALRAAAGLSQRDIADRAGMSFRHAQGVEWGQHAPTVGTLRRLGAVLAEPGDVLPSEVLRGERIAWRRLSLKQIDAIIAENPPDSDLHRHALRARRRLAKRGAA